MDTIKSRMLRDAVERLATRVEVAEYLGVPTQTLTQWAYKGTGPTYIKVGRHARYRWADVAKWVEQNTAGGKGAV